MLERITLFHRTLTIAWAILTKDDRFIHACILEHPGILIVSVSRRTTRLSAMKTLDGTISWLIVMQLHRSRCSLMRDMSHNSFSYLMVWKWRDRLDLTSIFVRTIWTRSRITTWTKRTTMERQANPGRDSMTPLINGLLVLTMTEMPFKFMPSMNQINIGDQEHSEELEI